MSRVILFTILTFFLVVYATVGNSQVFAPGNNVQNACTTMPDRWGIREPTTDEEREYGRGILVFEYWNSTAQCSENQTVGVYYNSPLYGELRFVMTVEVDAGPSIAEGITIDTNDTPYVSYTDQLILFDGEEPGTIILYPQLF